METKAAVNGGRIRKVTITEIENDEEWNWPDPGSLEEDRASTVMTKSTEEVFDQLDVVVQDWKKKLEIIVADGLKTIKKTTKEKKTMMKYLPGDALIGGSNATLKARCQILSEWKDEINRAFVTTHEKLNNLGNDKVQETTGAVNDLVPEEKQKENDCTTVSLDFDTLMRDLDFLYQKYNMNDLNKVPIYNVQNDFFKMKHAPFPWWKPVGTYAQLMNSPNQLNNPTEGNNNILSILQDFVADQKSQKCIMQEWKKMEEEKKKKSSGGKKESKTTRRGRDPAQKMKERRELRKYKQFLLREIVRKGETHYYLMKKEFNEQVNAEDIFADWNKNLAESKRPKTIRPRRRKISHRAERKEMIKQEQKRDVQYQGPLTYSQMLRKNMKLPVSGPEVEEMFGPWMKNVEKMYKPLKKSNAPDDLEVFNNWNFIFDKSVTSHPPALSALECGQPTVLRPPKQNVKKQSIEKLSAKLLAEGYPLGHSDETSGRLQGGKKSPTTVAVRNNKTSVVPFVERKSLVSSLSKVEPEAKGFKPSQHAQRHVLVNAIPQQTFIGPINKPMIPTPPPMPSFNWKELLACPSPREESGRGDTKTVSKPYKTEEIFDHWRHIFIDANKESVGKARKRTVREYKQDIYFMEWLRNLDEPVEVERKKDRKNSCSADEKTPSPTPSKRAEKKLVRNQFIEDDVTEIKDNRRQDFAKSRKIKDKKRTEASRNSLGKRVK